MNEYPRDASRGTFIDAMRHVACSVTVVTTDGVAGRHGATVSAFSSVSADPPMVLVCLRDGSRICEQVERNGCFTVNVLAEENLEVAAAFAGQFDTVRPDRFEGLDLIELSGLAPGLGDATIFACENVNSIVQGSHRIFFGKVAHAATAKRHPLTYLDGAYRSVRAVATA